MKAVLALAALIGGLASPPAKADTFMAGASTVTIESGQVGLVLRGTPEDGVIDRLLEPGIHPKAPDTESVVIMDAHAVRAATIRATGTLLDGPECWIDAQAHYRVTAPQKAFAWRRAMGLPIETADNPRTDYTEAKRIAEETLSRVISTISPPDAASGGVHLKVRFLAQELRSKPLDDGTSVLSLRLDGTNCDAVAAPFAPTAAAPSPKCTIPEKFGPERPYADRTWTHGAPATFFFNSRPRQVKRYNLTDLMTGDQARVQTELPRIGLRAIDPYSWKALFGKQDYRTMRMAGDVLKAEFRKQGAGVTRDKLAAHIEALPLEDLAQTINEKIAPSGYEVAEITFSGLRYRIWQDLPCK